MDAQKMEKQGTGLSDTFRILSEVPKERLLSLTFQLGKSLEEELVHTLCLMLLERDTRVQEQLQVLKDSSLANYLADKWHVSGGKLDAFKVQCAAHCQEEYTGHGAVELARVFKVLCKEKLCDPLLRDLAYRRAISANCQKTKDRQHLEYSCIDQLIEEAKLVCGPHVAEGMCSSNEVSYNELPGGLDKVKNAPLKPYSQDPSDLPSPLHDSYSTDSTDSYPSHLEISLPSTARFDRTTSATLSDPQPSNATHLVEKDGPETMAARRTASSTETHPTPLVKGERDVNIDTPSAATLSAKSNKLQSDISLNQKPRSTAPTFEPKPTPAAANTFTPEIKVPAQAKEGKRSTEEEEEEEEEEEDVFYSFVILHAPEDFDMAQSMRERLESLGISAGATFTEDFEVPGKRPLKCIEDAINNSAYTLLLLTRNFNTRLLEVKTDTALMNSINKRHKYNTVIPLMPQENRMPRESMPMVLQTFIPLVEGRAFERQAKKALPSAKVNKQRRMWVEEQRVRKQVRRQERLRRANEQQKLYNQELRNAKLLEQEKARLRMEQLCIERPPQQQHYPHMGPQFTNVPGGFVPPQVGEDGWLRSGNIHIEHANYIMIGNDSQMTVDLSGAASREDLSDDDDKLYRC